MSASTTTVRVRFVAPEHAAHVRAGGALALVGDFPDFRVLHPMALDDAGVPAVTLELATGVYRAKLLVDLTTWVVPRAVPEGAHLALEHQDGFENAVVVVAGERPPLFFAPDARHRRRDDDGALLVRAERARDDETARVVTVSLDDGTHVTAPLDDVLARGDRVLLSARVPLARDARGTFTLAPRPPADAAGGASSSSSSSGGVVGDAGAPLRHALPAWRGGRGPAWASEATLAFVLVDRWLRGRASAPEPRARPRTHPSYPTVFYGGDLAGVREALPYFAELGVDALVISPVHPSPTPHRYDGTDLLATDPALGGDDALCALVDEAHTRGLKILVDLSVTHVNHQHPFFKNVLDEQECSPMVELFRIKSFPVRRRDPSTYAHYWDCIDLPWLALENPRARDHAIAAARRYAALGVDGLRLDAMLDAPVPFWRALTSTLRREHPALFLMGEVVGDHPRPFLADDEEEDGAHAVTDARFREALLAFFARVPADDALARLHDELVFVRHRIGVVPDASRVIFLDTHDTGRFLSRVKDDDALALALVFTAFFPHPWLLTYGTECGLASRDDEPPLDGAWPERLPMPALDDARAHPLFRATQGALALRRTLREAGAGPLSLALASKNRLVMTRAARDGSVFALTLALDGAALDERGALTVAHWRGVGLMVHRGKAALDTPNETAREKTE